MAEPQKPVSETAGAETEIRDRIIATANRLFMEHKYSRVTMEEIASELGISKKTLYKHFPNKEEVLRGTVAVFMRQGVALMDPILNSEDLSFVERLHRFMDVVAQQSMKISPAIIEDIYKNAPEVWQEIDTFRQGRFRLFGELIKKGIDQGVLRSDLNKDLVVSLYMTMMRGMMVPQKIMTEGYAAKDVFKTIVTVFFEGMMTEPARQEYKSSAFLPPKPQHDADQ